MEGKQEAVESEKLDELIVWEAPVRPYKKRDRTFFQTVIALAFLLVVISFFLREWLLIGSILAIVFVSYALAAVPPGVVVNKITKKGVWTGDSFFKFSDLNQYWYEKQLESTVVVLSVASQNKQVVLVVPDSKKEHIDRLLREKLIFREKPLKTLTTQIGDWLKKRVPLEE